MSDHYVQIASCGGGGMPGSGGGNGMPGSGGGGGNGMPGCGPRYLTQYEVEQIIGNKMNDVYIGNLILNCLEKQWMKNKIDGQVREMCEMWVRSSLGTRVNGLVRDAMVPTFKNEVMEGGHTTSLVSEYLRSVERSVSDVVNGYDRKVELLRKSVEKSMGEVEKRVEIAADGVVERVVRSTTEFDVIFQKFFAIWSEKNTRDAQVAIEWATKELVDSKKVFDEVNNENAILKKQIISLRRSLTFTQIVFFIGVAAMIISLWAVCTDALGL